MCFKSIDTRFRQDAANRSERRLATPDDNSWVRRNRAGSQPCILTDLVDPPEATTRLRPRLIYRVHHARRHGSNRARASPKRTMPACWTPLISSSAGHWWSCGTTRTPHVSDAMADLIAAREWLTVYQLPTYAHELDFAPMNPHH
jgi:hypothetical protein